MCDDGNNTLGDSLCLMSNILSINEVGHAVNQRCCKWSATYILGTLAACTFLCSLTTVLLTSSQLASAILYNHESPQNSHLIPTKPLSLISMPFWKTAHQSITRNLFSIKRMARLIVFDFDGTVTQQDTINFLAQLPIYSNHLGRLREEARKKWRNIVDLYVADHAKHKESYVPKAEDRKTLAEELAYLESLRTVEVASAERVVNSKFFAWLTREQFVELGRRARENGEDPEWEGGEGEGDIVRVRKGFSEFVRQAKARGDKLGIVSVNWSQAFVEGVIEAEEEEEDVEDRDQGQCQGHKKGFFVKRVNEIKYPDGELEGPREMGGKVMMTARDKLEAFETMLSDEVADGDGDGEKIKEKRGRGSVYFGDSVTDLECLLRADTGIVVVNEGKEEKSKLLGTLQRLGFEVPHVSEARQGAKLAWARDFEEVLGSKILG